MPDPGVELEFGVFLTPDSGQVERTLALAQLADVSGLDIVSLQDHPYQAKHADTWTLLTAIGTRTSAIRVAPNVTNLPLRPPAVLAKSAATLDLLTGGRVELGLGAGAFWDGIVAAGGPRRTPKESVDALIEAIDILRQFWSGRTVRADGEHYQVSGLRPGPQPAHQIPIWIGAYGPRMLRVTGRLADAWIPSMGYVGPDKLPEMNALIDQGAVKAGRQPDEIRRLYNIHGRFGRGSGLLEGSPADWAEQLATLADEHRITGFILATDDADAIRTFAEEVAPAVRELVAHPPVTAVDQDSVDQSSVDQGRDEPAEPERESVDHAVVAGEAANQQLSVRPTPDDGVRLTGELEWQEGERPTVPAPQAYDYSELQLAQPQHLIDIHDGLRAELERVRDIVDQVRTGHLSVGQARSVINTMTMRQNNWTLGAYCASYCRIVTGHHTLEDRSVFPHLRRSDERLAPLMDRLEYEHEVIADVLDGLDQALVAVVDGEGYGSDGDRRLDALQHHVDLLTDTLLSHLSYEERELLHPLAQYGLN
ncbi:LLM class flavin-dependent oxidoreductase [Propionibacteriaceae bacterium Y2011]